MVVRAAWPTVSVGVAFTAGSFTETTGNTAGGAEAFTFTRGRQYELGRTQTGTGSVTFDNRDNRYTPLNSASPTPVGLYNEVQVVATWSGTTYPVMRGFVERWPVGFGASDSFPTSNVITVDAGAILSKQILGSTADSEVLADNPIWFYKLSEAAGASGAGDSSRNSNCIGLVKTGQYGGTLASFGGATSLVEGATGLSFPANSGVGTSAPYLPVTYLDIGSLSRPGSVQLPSSGAYTVEAWVSVKAAPTSGSYVISELNGFYGSNIFVRLVVNSGNSVVFQVGSNNGSGTFYTATPTATVGVIANGNLHHIVGTVDATGLTATLYVDGVSVATATAPGPLLQFSQVSHTVGASSNYAPPVSQFYGTIARYAGYGTALSAARILQHYRAGATAFAGEDGGARITRLLGYVGWPTALTDVTAGASTFGPSFTNGKGVLETIQTVADDELGNLWFSAAGKVTFRSRNVRYTTTASTVTFGELTASGEVPYNDTAVFDFDPTYVITSQKVTRTGGVVTTAYAATSPLPYAKAASDRTVAIQNDTEAADQATWLVGQYSKPRVRVASLTITPSGNPALWPVALGTEINTRVTVKRRVIGQAVMSIDCWVESVTHSTTPDSWVTTFLLSPCDSPHAMLWDTDNWDDPNAVWTF